MSVPSFPMIASFVLLAAPALAQPSGMTGGQLSDAASSSRLPPDTVVTLDTQQKLKSNRYQPDTPPQCKAAITGRLHR